MQGSSRNYLGRLSEGVADGWNRFWFTPSDPYPLGVIRLLAGGLATYFHLTLLPDVARWYAADGWITREAVDRLVVRGGNPTYFDLFQSAGELYAVQLVATAVLVAFTIGFWSRVSSILALVVILSDIHRGPMLTSQFEPVLTMILCYLCLGPSGASWSVDRLLAHRRAKTATEREAAEIVPFSWGATVALRLMQVHLAMLVATMAGSQLLGSTWWAGTGVWWLATRPESRLVDFTWLGEYAINFWSHAVIAAGLAFPILVWVPLLRPLVLVLAGLVWISLALVSGQVTFTLAMLVAAISFCSSDWLRSCCEKSPSAELAAVS